MLTVCMGTQMAQPLEPCCVEGALDRGRGPDPDRGTPAAWQQLGGAGQASAGEVRGWHTACYGNICAYELTGLLLLAVTLVAGLTMRSRTGGMQH